MTPIPLAIVRHAMIRYTDSLDGIVPEQLRGGFFIGWFNPPSPESHLRILNGSYAVWLAIDDDSGQVVGFINAISDGVHAAYLPLLEVLPDYQGRGTGIELARRMIETLRHCYQIDLICDPDVQPFYEKLGMHRAVGMITRNYDRQNAPD